MPLLNLTLLNRFLFSLPLLHCWPCGTRRAGGSTIAGAAWPCLAPVIIPAITPFGAAITAIIAVSTVFTALLPAFPAFGALGRGQVLAAVIPGRCAAPPAPAMITSSPRSSAVAAYSNNKSGVR